MKNLIVSGGTGTIGSLLSEALRLNGYFVTVIFAQVVLSILASIVVMYFSRKREFIADTGGADLAGHQNMINALKRLAQKEPEPLPEQLSAFGIGEKPKTGWSQLWA